MRIEPIFLFDLDGTLVDSVYQHVLAWTLDVGRAVGHMPLRGHWAGELLEEMLNATLWNGVQVRRDCPRGLATLQCASSLRFKKL
jgi:phosphoglycolate phosphatase-like HAD superfamily hydrolase